MGRSAYEDESSAASFDSDDRAQPAAVEGQDRSDGAGDHAGEEDAAEESVLDRARRPESVDERSLRVRQRLRGWLIGGGLFVVLFSGAAAFTSVSGVVDCGVVAESSVTRTLELLTRPGEIPEPDDDARYCAGERLPRQLATYGAAQLGLIVVAVGLFLRPNPKVPVPTSGRVRRTQLGVRTAAVLLPALLLAGEAIVVVTTEAHPDDQWGLSRADGKHRSVPSACELVAIPEVRDLVRNYWKFDARGEGDSCNLHWRSPDGTDTHLDVAPVFGPWGQNPAVRYGSLGEELAKVDGTGDEYFDSDSGDWRREFCDKNIRLVADACVTPRKERTELDLPGRKRTLVVTDGNLHVVVEVATDRHQVLTKQRMRTVAAAVRQGIAR